jgi:phospholipid/cholesterol/gamma-HCH transport system substrate-binding protein
MEKSRLEIKVGLFVFIGLAVLAALLIQFSKGTSPFLGHFTLRLHAQNAGGLKKDAGVLLSGVPVGSVQSIVLEPSGTNVIITLQIYNNFPIYHDARFVIEASGFLGDQFVSVVPTANTLPLLTNGQDVACESPFNLQEVARGAAGFIQRLDNTAKKLDASVSDLRSQVLNAETLASFGNTMTNLRTFTEQANDTLSDIHGLINTNSGNVTAAVSNIVLFSTQLNQLGDLASNILATNGANLTAATKNIQGLTEDVKAGKGVAGALLQNQQVSTNIQLLAANLSIASSNLNRFGLWHFLWSKQPAKPDNQPTHK